MPVDAAAYRPCSPFPLAYNLTLNYGFVSFAFSLPVVMALLACLARFLTADRVKVWLGIATAFFAVLLFLFHLQNFLYGVCAGLAFLVFADAGWRRRLLALGTFAPALALLVRWHVSHEYAGPAGRNSPGYAWDLLLAKRRAEIGTRGWIEDFIERLEYLPIHLLRGFTDNVDVVVGQALVLVLAGYLLLGAVGLLAPPGTAPRPRLRVAGWIAFAGALFAYLIFPHHLPEYELMTFHPRFSVLAMATALLLIPASLRRLPGASRGFLLLPALTVSFYYAAELVTHYRLYDKEVADFDAVVSKTPAGGRAVGLVFDRQSRVMRNESSLVGLPSLYPVLRPSATAMVPIFYCGMRHMPCRRLTPEKPMPELSPWAPYSLQPEPAIDFFEYFFVRLPPARPIFGTALNRLELIASEGSWLVYRRKPGPRPRPRRPTRQPPPRPDGKGPAARSRPVDRQNAPPTPVGPLSLFFVAAGRQTGEHPDVLEGRGVALRHTGGGDLLEQSTHDLPRTGFG